MSDDMISTIAEQADALAALQQQLDEARAERDEWKASSKMFEATAAEAARGLECLSEIDDAWDAFGSAGNRKVLTLAEQIASRERELEAAERALSARDAAWKPIETYNREKGEIAALLDWFTYRTDPAKKPQPVRYVGSWSADHEAWFDDDGMDLDIDPTHWLPLPVVPERNA